MPRLRELKTNFVAGELDDLLQGRSDVKHYFNGADFMRNVIVIPQGGAQTRPGTRFLWTVPEVSPGVPSNVRLAPFQFSTDQTYLFVFHHLKATIFRDGVEQATIVTPWTSAQLKAEETAKGDLISSGIYWTQSVDTMLVFHQSHEPRQIQRTGSHTSWAISDWELRNIPRYAFPGVTYVNGVNEVQTIAIKIGTDTWDYAVGDTFALVLEDEETDNIQLTGTRAQFAAKVQAALRALPQISGGVTVTVAVDPGAPVATGTLDLLVTFAGDDGQRPWGAMGFTNKSVEQNPGMDILVSTKGEYPGEDTWSNTVGWPRCGLFFQGRLWMAGTPSLPNTLWASRSGDPNDFNAKKIADDYGITATTDTDDVPAFIAMYAGRHLQVFSTSAEFYVPSSESEAVTPANIVLRRTTSRGAKPGVRVAEVDGATIFVQRRGKALREFIFADVELAYQANNVSLLASHLVRDPVDMCLRRSTSTDDADFLFMPNIDGTMSLFCTLRTQEVNAMTLWETEGSFIAAASLLDDVYFATRRIVDGSTKTFLEIMDDTLAIDCAVIGSGAFSGAGAPHLPNTLLAVEIDGHPQDSILSNGLGNVVFPHNSSLTWALGLDWPEVLPDEHPGLRWCVKTLPIEAMLQDGTMMGRKRRIVNLSVRLHETSGLILNGNRISFQNFGALVLDQPPIEFTGVKHLRGLLGWDYEGQVVMGDTLATKATILGLAWAVSV